MTIEEALVILETSLDRGRLNRIQELVFRQVWEGRSYSEIATQFGYDVGYIKNVASHLWRNLSKQFGEKVTKNNVQSVLKRRPYSNRVVAVASGSARNALAPVTCFSTSQGHDLRSIDRVSKISAPAALPVAPPLGKGKTGGWGELCLSPDGLKGTANVLDFPAIATHRHQDWGEAIDVSQFYGREEELQTLDTWILEDGCRGIGIFGLGGMGKTALSVKLAHQVQSYFGCVIWRSLQQAPSLSALLSEILPILVGSEVVIDCSINALMKQLRSKRCLLVLDNVESILQGGNRTGQYQPGYEAYRQLFDRIFDEPHQSCLMITGREKPGGFAVREGKNLPVRSLQLQGLSGAEGEQILIAKGLNATKSQRLALVKHLGCNPLALKLAATTISTLFGGSIQAFLAQGRTVFSDLWDLLAQQFQRLSPLQQQIMYCLAIHREGITPTQLQQEILPKVPWRELFEALESRDVRSARCSSASRSRADRGKGNLTLQPVIKEYVTERFIQTIEREIATWSSVNSSVGIG